MGKSALNTEAATSAVMAIYAAINRNDVPAAIKLLDPQIEWIEPDTYPEGGTTRGLDAVTALHERALGTWAEGGCEPDRIIVSGDKVIVFVDVHVRLKNNANWIQGRLADVYTFRNGKIIQKRTFDEPRQALKWVGIDVPDEN